MTYIKTLEDYLDEKPVENIIPHPSIDMGKIVRDAVYHSLDPNKLGEQLSEVLEQYLSHPDGISDYDIGKLIGLPRDRVGARRHDLKKLGVPIISFGVSMNFDTSKPNNVWGISNNGGSD